MPEITRAWIDALYRGAVVPMRDSDRLRVIADRLDEIDDASDKLLEPINGHKVDRGWQYDLRRIADRLDAL